MTVGELIQRVEDTYELARHFDKDFGKFNDYHWIIGYDAFCILASNTRLVYVDPDGHYLHNLPIFIDHRATMRIELYRKAVRYYD